MRLASFDIFDTLLIRKCGKPENIFYWLAKRLFPTDEIRTAAFMAWRKQAEQQACSRNNSRNVSFEQIYEAFDERNFGLTKEGVAAAEKETEKQNLIANPSMQAIIGQKRAEGFTICFISDMYFDAAFLREILESQNLIRTEEEIFVSSEWNRRKSTGELFGIVREKYKPSHWEHYGDNYTSDCVQARKAGIHPFHIDTGYTPAEKYIGKIYSAHPCYPKLSVFIGFQRAARIIQGNNAFSEMAADFVAPVYISYVHYVLEQARKEGLKRLYFVNRDGHILLKVAEMLAPEYPELELKYIFISRRSIILPSLAVADPALFIETLNPPTLIGKKVNQLLNYLDIRRDQFEETGITFDYERITTAREADDFIDKVFRSGYTPVWKTHVQEAGKRFKEYLDQEGLTDGTKSALVDLGWYGSTRLMLNRILGQYGYPPVPFFYFAVAGNAISAEHGNYFTYTSYRIIQNTGIMSLMEHYFSACPYGSTLAYEEQNGRIVPVLEAPVQTLAYEQILSANRKAARQIISFCREFSDFYCFPIREALVTDYLLVMAGQKVKINLQACSSIGPLTDFDGSKRFFLKKLTFAETLHYTLLGNRITDFDRGSTAFTYGNGVSGMLGFLHAHSARLRRFFYNRYLFCRKKWASINP